MRVTWLDRTTNVDIPLRMRNDKEAVKAVRARKLQYVRHQDKYEQVQYTPERFQRRSPRKMWAQSAGRYYGLKTSEHVLCDYHRVTCGE